MWQFELIPKWSICELFRTVDFARLISSSELKDDMIVWLPQYARADLQANVNMHNLLKRMNT